MGRRRRSSYRQHRARRRSRRREPRPRPPARPPSSLVGQLLRAPRPLGRAQHHRRHRHHAGPRARAPSAQVAAQAVAAHRPGRDPQGRRPGLDDQLGARRPLSRPPRHLVRHHPVGAAYPRHLVHGRRAPAPLPRHRSRRRPKRRLESSRGPRPPCGLDERAQCRRMARRDPQGRLRDPGASAPLAGPPCLSAPDTSSPQEFRLSSPFGLKKLVIDVAYAEFDLCSGSNSIDRVLNRLKHAPSVEEVEVRFSASFRCDAANLDSMAPTITRLVLVEKKAPSDDRQVRVSLPFSRSLGRAHTHARPSPARRAPTSTASRTSSTSSPSSSRSRSPRTGSSPRPTPPTCAPTRTRRPTSASRTTRPSSPSSSCTCATRP